MKILVFKPSHSSERIRQTLNNPQKKYDGLTFYRTKFDVSILQSLTKFLKDNIGCRDIRQQLILRETILTINDDDYPILQDCCEAIVSKFPTIKIVIQKNNLEDCDQKMSYYILRSMVMMQQMQADLSQVLVAETCGSIVDSLTLEGVQFSRNIMDMFCSICKGTKLSQISLSRPCFESKWSANQIMQSIMCKPRTKLELWKLPSDYIDDILSCLSSKPCMGNNNNDNVDCTFTDLVKVENLDLTNTGLQDNHIGSVISILRNIQVDKLCIKLNRITANGITTLLSQIPNQCLKDLEMCENGNWFTESPVASTIISNRSVSPTISSYENTLEIVSLARVGLKDSDLEVIIPMLSRIQKLELDGNYLTSLDAFVGQSNCNIKNYLLVKNDDIGGLPCLLLPILIHLTVSDNAINDVGISSFLECFSTGKIKKFIASSNNLTDVSAYKIAKLLKQEDNCTLEFLDLADNDFEDDGMKQLTNASCCNSKLKELDISWNNVKDDMSIGRQFLGALQTTNFTLVELDFWNKEESTNEEQYDLSMQLIPNIHYWLVMNKHGRELLRHSNIPPGLWSFVLAQTPRYSWRSPTNQQDLIYYMLQQSGGENCMYFIK